MRVGDPDGFGRYGHLDTIEDRLLCHECGSTYRHLATHLARTHATTADSYRLAHGLPLTIPLVAPSVQTKMRESWQAKESLHMAALEAHRRPNEARLHNRSPDQWTAATRAQRIAMLESRRGRLLTADEMRNLGDDVPLQQWCDRVRALLASDPALSQASIGRSFDRSTQWVSQRLRRYPPRER